MRVTRKLHSAKITGSIYVPHAYLGWNSGRGFSLLEVLIALLVLSVGLVGVAALSIQSVQNVHSSLQLSIATAAALDFEERLWLDLGTRSGGCPDPGAIREEFRLAWDSSEEANQVTNRLGLPGLNVTGTPTTSTGNDALQFQFDLGWNEERFKGSEGGEERFSYRLEIQCRLPLST